VTRQAESDGPVRGVRARPPSGLIAMLFTDIEGSTRLASSLGDGWVEVLATYHEIVEGVVRSAGGWVDGTTGDGFFITFGDVSEAGRAAVAIQRRLRTCRWPAAVGELKVRMGLHVGQVERRAHGYVGLEIHRAARVGAAAHGGQMLMTGVAADLLRQVVPSQPLGAHRLKDFPAPTALYCAVIDGQGAGEFPPPRTLELRAGSVPAMPVALIGRERDLERVRAALLGDGERLVTVLGRGGVGKTSLALAAANDLVEDYEGGVWWIDAHQERDAAGLCALIARGCRISAEGAVKEALIADLGSRGPLLLVLDNLEGIPGTGSLLDSLLARLPDLRVLATSQLPLRCQRERRLQLDRLGESDALALLSRTAQRLDVALENDPASAELITLLDGLPLAIELAAGRLRLFHLADLVRRLRDSTAILEDRTRPNRHRSLTAALEWTLDLLDSDACELLTRLGIFAGPIELDDIEVVAGEGLDVISAIATLLDVSLLQRVESGDGLVRFGLPEAVRQEARRRLDPAAGEARRRAHAIWQRDLVWPLRIFEIADSRLVERAHAAAAETQVALVWAWDHDRQLGREIALGRHALASRAGAAQEAGALIERVLADPGDDPRVIDLVREHALLSHGEEAHDPARSLMSLLPELTDTHARFLCLMNMAIVLGWEARFDEALVWMDRALELAREISPLALASALVVKADLFVESGRDDDAESAIRESDAIAGPLRSPNRDVIELIRANLASRRGAHADAFDRFARALTHAELVGDSSAIHMIVASLGHAFERAGREPQMLETAGILEALVAEESTHGTFAAAVLGASEIAIAAAIARLGPAGNSIRDAGRAVEPAQRTNRIYALIYAD
jgi:class 3 adenylate cyclase/predicted ATPase